MLGRSNSERPVRERGADAERLSALPSSPGPGRHAPPASVAEPEDDGARRGGGFSLRRLSRSLRIGKGKTKDAQAAPPAPPTPAAPVQRSKSGIMRFFSSLRGKKSTPALEPATAAVPVPLAPADGAARRSDYFKSKKVCARRVFGG